MRILRILRRFVEYNVKVRVVYEMSFKEYIYYIAEYMD